MMMLGSLIKDRTMFSWGEAGFGETGNPLGMQKRLVTRMPMKSGAEAEWAETALARESFRDEGCAPLSGS